MYYIRLKLGKKQPRKFWCGLWGGVKFFWLKNLLIVVKFVILLITLVEVKDELLLLQPSIRVIQVGTC